MSSPIGKHASKLLVHPWFTACLVVVVATYTIGAVDITPAVPAKLNPPTGRIGGTMKTLDEVQPRTPVTHRYLEASIDATFVIDEPGSYFLTGDIEAQANTYGIKVMAAPVTIDLMGYAIDGNFASNDLIHVDALADRVVIRNGTLRRSGERGLDSYADTIHVEMLEVVETLQSGVSLDVGRAATLRDVSVADAGTDAGGDLDGVRLLGPGTVRARDLDITGVGGTGLSVDGLTRLTLTDSSVSDTREHGVSAGERGVVRNIRVTRPGRHAIRAGDDTIVEGCHVEDPGEDGIHAAERAHIVGNRVFAQASRAWTEGCAIRVLGDDTIVTDNTCVGGGVEFYSVIIEGERTLFARNRGFENGGFNHSMGTIVGRIISGAAAYEAVMDPRANIAY